MTISWKRFKFYQDAESRVVDFPSTPLCCDAGSEELVFGCEGGELFVLNRELRPLTAVKAYAESLLQLQILKGQDVLVTLGTEEPGVSSATVKLWSVGEVITAGERQAQPLKAQKLFSVRFPESEITAMTVAERPDGTCLLAVGLASGMVYWTHGDLVKDRFGFQKLSAQLLGSSDRFCVKGLGIYDQEEKLCMYVVTESQTLVFNLVNGAKIVLDEAGAEDHCVMMQEDGQLLVARPQALYFYNIEGRGACFAFREDHHHMTTTGHDLAVAVNTKRETGAVAEMIKIYDLANKLSVGERNVSNVRHVLRAWGNLLVIQGDGSIIALREIPLASKLEALFRRSCHAIAVRLAEAERAAPETMAYIHHQFADYLYSEQHDHDGAMNHYIETIGYLEPSYVIRRYLEGQRIQQLSLYLEALHEREHAIRDHTTLLLNCYTKMKDVDKLNSFIGVGEGSGQGRQRQHRTFEVATAVKVLRTAGYYSHALEVARSANEPHWYVDIVLEDLGHYDEGIQYIADLPRRQAADIFRKYGKLLVQNRPRDTTGCLIQLCVPDQDAKTNPNSDSEYVAGVSDFTHLYTDHPDELKTLCECVFHVYAQLPGSPPGEAQLYHTLFELYLTGTEHYLQRVRSSQEMDHLEYQDDEDEDKRGEALDLLKKGWPPGDRPKYESEHMLVLCQMYKFKEGLVFLYDRKRLLREVLQVYIDSKDYDGIIYACRCYGNSASGGDPSLWSTALQYFSTNKEDCTTQIKEVLEHVEREEVLPPLVVLRTLAENKNFKLSIVKDYIARQITKDSCSIRQDREEIERLKKESTELRDRIQELKTQPQVCNNNWDKLAEEALEMPAVHFLCKHSFNLSTISENPTECPLCRPKNEKILKIRRDMKAGASHQDQFFMELKGQKDGFAIVAEWFGRGMLNAKSTPTQD